MRADVAGMLLISLRQSPWNSLQTLCAGSVENEAHDKDTNVQLALTCDEDIHRHFGGRGACADSESIQDLSAIRHIRYPHPTQSVDWASLFEVKNPVWAISHAPQFVRVLWYDC